MLFARYGQGLLFSTNGKPASASFSALSIEKPSSPPGPSLVNSASFHRRCAKPSASTTNRVRRASQASQDPRRPTFFCDPHSPCKKAAWKTPSGAYDARCPAKLTSTPSPTALKRTFNTSTYPTQLHTPNSTRHSAFAGTTAPINTTRSPPVHPPSSTRRYRLRYARCWPAPHSSRRLPPSRSVRRRRRRTPRGGRWRRRLRAACRRA